MSIWRGLVGSIGCCLAVSAQAIDVSGVVFEDANGDGIPPMQAEEGSLSGDAPSFDYVTLGIGYNNDKPVEGVSVYKFCDSNGNGVPDAADTVDNVESTETNADGVYSFSDVDAGCFIAVDSRTFRTALESNVPDSVWAEQTYSGAGGLCRRDYNDGDAAPVTTAGSCYSGRRPDVSDGFTSGSIDGALAEHVIKVGQAGFQADAADFGFSYNVMTTVRSGAGSDDDDPTAERTVQGSINQLIKNANILRRRPDYVCSERDTVTPGCQLVNPIRFLGPNATFGASINLRFYPTAAPSNPYAWQVIADSPLDAVLVDGVQLLEGIYNIDGVYSRQNHRSIGLPNVPVAQQHPSCQHTSRSYLSINFNNVNEPMPMLATHGEFTRLNRFNVYGGRDNASNGDVAPLIKLHETATHSSLFALGVGNNRGIIGDSGVAYNQRVGVLNHASNVSMSGVTACRNQSGIVLRSADNANVVQSISITRSIVSFNGTEDSNRQGGNGIEIKNASGVSVGATTISHNFTASANAGFIEGNGVLVMENASRVSLNVIANSNDNHAVAVGSNINQISPQLISLTGTYNNNGDSAIAVTANVDSVRFQPLQSKDNGGLSIDLIADYPNASNPKSLGVTPNDGLFGAEDTGSVNGILAPNNGLDYPILNSINLVNGKLNISGFIGDGNRLLNTNNQVSIRFYYAANDRNQDGEIVLGDGANVPHGELERFLGSCNNSSGVDAANGLFSCEIDTPDGFNLSAEIVAIATETIPGGGRTSEVSNPAGAIINGYIFEDIDADGLPSGQVKGDAQNPMLANVAVSLYCDGGDNVLDGGDELFVATKRTNADGFYEFNTLGGLCWVMADSTTVVSTAPSVSNQPSSASWAEQTWSGLGGRCANANNDGSRVLSIAGPCVGGVNATQSDQLASQQVLGAEHLIEVNIANNPALVPLFSNRDFGFSFSIVSNMLGGDEQSDAADGRSVQGSLRQCMVNANNLLNHSRLLLPNDLGNAESDRCRFVPQTPPTINNGWEIVISNPLPVITHSNLVLDGRAYRMSDTGLVLRNERDANITAARTVGVNAQVIEGLEQPELSFNFASQAVGQSGLIVQATNVTLGYLHLINQRTDNRADPASASIVVNADQVTLQHNIINATLTGDKADLEHRGAGIRLNNVSNSVVMNNYITGSAHGLAIYNGRQHRIGNNQLLQNGGITASQNRIGHNVLLSNVSEVELLNNAIIAAASSQSEAVHNGHGVMIRNGSERIALINNDIDNNAGGGITIGSNVAVQSNADAASHSIAIQHNRIINNGNNGVWLVDTVRNVTMTDNEVRDNARLGIDLQAFPTPANLSAAEVPEGVTGNDGIVGEPQAGSGSPGPNIDLDYPIITDRAVSGNQLTLSGFIGRFGQTITANDVGSSEWQIDFYQALDDGNQNGEVFADDGSQVAHGEGGDRLGRCTSTDGINVNNGSFACVLSLANFPSDTGLNTPITSTLTVYTGTMTVGDSSYQIGHTSEFSASANKTLSGLVFEDSEYGGMQLPSYAGGEGRAYQPDNVRGQAVVPGATVELYDYNFNTQNYEYRRSTQTDANGRYEFYLTGGQRCAVRVVNSTVRSQRAGGRQNEFGIQTYRVDGLTLQGQAEPAGIGTRLLGGLQPRYEDAPANNGSQNLAALQSTAATARDANNNGIAETTQSVAIVDVTNGGREGINFGFNFSTVVNTNDRGQGSLRQAILNANLLNNVNPAGQPLNQSGPDNADGINRAITREHILLMVPGSNDHLQRPADPRCQNRRCAIELNTTLPVVTEPLVVDGERSSAMFANSNFPAIALNGSAITGNNPALQFGNADSTLRGVQITRMPAVGVRLAGTGSHLVDNVVIGLQLTQGAGNSVTNQRAGVLHSGLQIQSNNNRIVGIASSANGRDGIHITGNNNIVAGQNRIGLGVSVPTTQAFGNARHGIAVNGAASGNRIGSLTNGNIGNQIAHNAGDGVHVADQADANSMVNNQISANAGLAIDLAGGQENSFGVNALVAQTGGPNDLLQYPAISNVSRVNGGAGTATQAEITLFFGGQAGFYRLDFARDNTDFASPALDPSGHGEAAAFVDSVVINHPGGQRQPQTVQIAVSGELVNLTATATQCLDGASCQQLGSTSEWSASINNLIRGVVFEDINYGGTVGSTGGGTAGSTGGSTSNGQGRNLNQALADGALRVPNASVYLYQKLANDNAFNLIGTTTTDSTGTYEFITAASSGQLAVRIVNQTVSSRRPGGSNCGANCLPVQTYRARSLTEGDGFGARRVGGEYPALQDIGIQNLGDELLLTPVGQQVAQSVVIFDARNPDSAYKSRLDFGFNFSTVVNTKAAGQGSLAQMLSNANRLGNNGLAQDLSQHPIAALTTGQQPETSIFMLPMPMSARGSSDILGRRVDSNCDVQQCQITLGQTLPALTETVALDGFTQAGSQPNTAAYPNGLNAQHAVALNYTGNDTMLAVNANNSRVSGLSISAPEATTAVQIGATGQARNVAIAGNQIGVDANAMLMAPQVAIRVAASQTDAVIGGSSNWQRNTLIGQTHDVQIATGAHRTVVQGNMLGLAANGDILTTLLANRQAVGIELRQVNDFVLQQNIIGNRATAISTTGGRGMLNNSLIGVFANNARANTQGLQLDQQVTVTGVTVANSEQSGILLGSNNEVSNSSVLANEIGVFIDGNNNLVGGLTAAQGNQIDNHARDGVKVLSGRGNTITANAMRNNGTPLDGLAIDLDEDGNANTDDDVTENDVQPGSIDVDTGANDLLNYPVTFSVGRINNNVDVQVIFDLEVNNQAAAYRIDFYDNPSGIDGNRFGNGEQHISSAIVPGRGRHRQILAGAGQTLSDVTHLTMTATECQDAACQQLGSTSEFNSSFNRVSGIASTRQASAVTDNNLDGSFDVTYTIRFANTGNERLFDLQLTDYLSSVFGAYQTDATVTNEGEYYLLTPPELTLNPDNRLATNPGFTGVGERNAARPSNQLLNAQAGFLDPEEQAELRYTIRFVPDFTQQPFLTQTIASGDLSEQQNGVPDGDQIDESDDHPEILIPDRDRPTAITVPVDGRVGLALQVADIEEICEGSDGQGRNDVCLGVFEASLAVRGRNLGNVRLYDTQVELDLTSTFGDYVPSNHALLQEGQYTLVQVPQWLTAQQSGIATDTGNTNDEFSLNTAYTGQANQSELLLLDATDREANGSLAHDESFAVNYRIRFIPDLARIDAPLQAVIGADVFADWDGQAEANVNDLSDAGAVIDPNQNRLASEIPASDPRCQTNPLAAGCEDDPTSLGDGGGLDLRADIGAALQLSVASIGGGGGNSSGNDIVDHGDGSFSVPLHIQLQNFGNQRLYNVQAELDLATVFGRYVANSNLVQLDGEYGIETELDIVQQADDLLAANRQFDGRQNQQLLDPQQGSLRPFERVSMTLTVLVFPDESQQPWQLTLRAGGDEFAQNDSDADFSVSDIADDGDEIDANGNRDPSERAANDPVCVSNPSSFGCEDDPTLIDFPFEPKLGIARRLVSVVEVPSEVGLFEAKFAVLASNIGNQRLHDVLLYDDLTSAFGEVVPDVSSLQRSGQYVIHSPPRLTPVTRNASAPLTPNANFTGNPSNSSDATAGSVDSNVNDAVLNLLQISAGGSLKPGDQIEVEYSLRFRPDLNRFPFATQVLGIADDTANNNNQASSRSNAAVSDWSDDGTEVDANGNGLTSELPADSPVCTADPNADGCEDDPTLMGSQLPIRNALGMTKQVVAASEVSQGIFSVTYAVTAHNLGNVDYYELQMTDDLSQGSGQSSGQGLGQGLGQPVASAAELTADGLYTVISEPEIVTPQGSNQAENFVINPDFNGASNRNLLVDAPTTDAALGVADTLEIRYTVHYRPDPLQTPDNGTPLFSLSDYRIPYFTQANGQAYLRNRADGRLATDLSDDAALADSNQNGTASERASDDPACIADPSTDGCEDDLTPVIPSFQPSLGVAKGILPGSFVDYEDGTFSVIYVVKARNVGNIRLADLQLTDSLTEAFGQHVDDASRLNMDGSYTLIEPPQFTQNAQVPFTLNRDYDGAQSTESMLLNIAAGGVLDINETIDIRYTLRFRPAAANSLHFTQVQGVADIINRQDGVIGLPSNAMADVTDLSDDGLVIDPNNNRLTSELAADSNTCQANPEADGCEDDPTPLKIDVPALAGAALQLVNLERQTDNSWVATYDIRIQNTGSLRLYDITAEYPLGANANVTSQTSIGGSFGQYLDAAASLADFYARRGVYALTVQPRFKSNSADPLIINPNFDGQNDVQLLQSGGSLAPRESAVMTVQIHFLPDFSSDDYATQVVLRADSVPGDGGERGELEETAVDFSDDGSVVDADQDRMANEGGPNCPLSPAPADSCENDPTILSELEPIPKVGSALYASIPERLTSDGLGLGSYRLTITLLIENLGDRLLGDLHSELDLQDALGTPVFTAASVDQQGEFHIEDIRVVAGDVTINSNYDGVFDTSLLTPADSQIDLAEVAEIELDIIAYPAFDNAPFGMQATVTGDETTAIDGSPEVDEQANIIGSVSDPSDFGDDADPNQNFIASEIAKDDPQCVADHRSGGCEDDLTRLGFSLGLVRINKTTSVNQVTIADLVPYNIEVTNVSSANLDEIILEDNLPNGFTYVKNSAQLIRAGADGELATTDDQIIDLEVLRGDPTLVYMPLAAGETIHVRYLTQVGAGALPGAATNVAVARRDLSDLFPDSVLNDANASLGSSALSLPSQATVTVVADPIFDESTIIGRVYADQNNNGRFDEGERSVAGARIATVTGLITETDENGLYHIAAIPATPFYRTQLFVAKLDADSLPAGSEITTRNPVIIAMTGSLMDRINFGVLLPEAAEEALARPCLPADLGISVEQIEREKVVKDQVAALYFERGKADITDAYLMSLQKVLRSLRDKNNLRIRVVGHTDDELLSVRTAKRYNDNMGLSEARARMVADEIILRLRLNPDDVLTEGRAYTEPMATNLTAAGRAKNRRVEIEFIYDELQQQGFDSYAVLAGHDAEHVACSLGTTKITNVTTEEQTYYEKVVLDEVLPIVRVRRDQVVADNVNAFKLMKTLAAHRYNPNFSVTLYAHSNGRGSAADQRIQAQGDAQKLAGYLQYHLELDDSQIRIVNRGGNESLVSVATDSQLGEEPAKPKRLTAEDIALNRRVQVVAQYDKPNKVLVDTVQVTERSVVDKNQPPRKIYENAIRVPGQHKAGIIWTIQEPLVDDLRLAASAERLPTGNYRFGVSTNYRPFIREAYIEIISQRQRKAYRLDMPDLAWPAVADWTPPVTISGKIGDQNNEGSHNDLWQYRVVAIGHDGHRDLTALQTLPTVIPEASQVVDQANEANQANGSNQANQQVPPITALHHEPSLMLKALLGRNQLVEQHIGVHGNRLRIMGKHLAPETVLQVNGNTVVIAADGRFIFEQYWPIGEHYIPVAAVPVNNLTDTPTKVAAGEYTPESAKERWREVLNFTIEPNHVFMVGIASLRYGANDVTKQVEGLSDEHFSGEKYTDGRLALYLKGKVLGRYLVTAHLDTTDDDLDNLRSNLRRRDRDALFRRLDPDRYYPVYGDGSTTYSDVNTQGALYVKVEWDESEAIWGNYHTGLAGNELAEYNRTLYGAKVAYRLPKTNRYGDNQLNVKAFAAEADTARSHNSFRSTGGSLYYLRNQEIVQGSEKIWLEIRQRDTNQIIDTTVLAHGDDYEIDYLQGRIILTRPLPQFADAPNRVIRDGDNGSLSDDHPVYLHADYEYFSPQFSGENTVMGLRANGWVDDNIGLGLTVVEEDRSDSGGDQYRLFGADFVYRFAEQTYVKIESARSQAQQTAHGFLSSDGGLNFNRITPTNADNGNGKALGIEAQVALEEWLDDTHALFRIWHKRRDEKFSGAQRLDNSEATVESGIEADWQLHEAVSLNASYTDFRQGDHEQRVANLVLSAEMDSIDLVAEIRNEQEQRKNRFIGFTSNNGAHSSTTEATLAGLRLGWHINADHYLYVEAQAALSADDHYADNQGYGLGWQGRLTDKLAMELEVFNGDRGTAATAGLSYALRPDLVLDLTAGYGDASNAIGATYTADGYDLYGQYSVQPDQRGGEKVLTVGQRQAFGSDLRVFAEHRFTEAKQQQGAGHVFGLDYEIATSWTMNLSFELSELESAGSRRLTTERQVASLGSQYKSDEFKASLRLEMRSDQYQQDSSRDLEQWVISMTTDWRYSAGLTLLSRLNMAKTEQTSDGADLGEFMELSLGWAYRPLQHDDLNVIGKLTFLQDTGGPNEVINNTDQKAMIVALEAIYDFTEDWEFGAKLAYKRNQLRFTNAQQAPGDWFESSAALMIGRARYRYAKWDLVGEYRYLTTPSADQDRSGFLFAFYRHLHEHVMVGAGYNFTSFGDDLGSSNYENHGWFFDVVGNF